MAEYFGLLSQYTSAMLVYGHSQSGGTPSKEVIYLNYSNDAGQPNITLENLSRWYNRPLQSS